MVPMFAIKINQNPPKVAMEELSEGSFDRGAKNVNKWNDFRSSLKWGSPLGRELDFHSFKGVSSFGSAFGASKRENSRQDSHSKNYQKMIIFIRYLFIIIN